MLCTLNMKKKTFTGIGQRRTELHVNTTVGFGTITRDLLSLGISCTVGGVQMFSSWSVEAVSNKRGTRIPIGERASRWSGVETVKASRSCPYVFPSWRARVLQR